VALLPAVPPSSGACIPRLAQASDPTVDSKKIAVMARFKIVL
jgi:hypothetical protein